MAFCHGPLRDVADKNRTLLGYSCLRGLRAESRNINFKSHHQVAQLSVERNV